MTCASLPCPTRYRIRRLIMFHAPSFGSDMNRAFSFVACCTSTRLIDMQLALIVVLLLNNESKISQCLGPASIWLRDSDRPTRVTKPFKIVTGLSSPLSGPRTAYRLKISFSLRRRPRQLQKNSNEDTVISLNETTHLAFTTTHDCWPPRTNLEVQLNEHALPLLPIVRYLPRSVERFQELSDHVIAFYLLSWR